MTTTLTEQEIRAGIERLAPFRHSVDLPYDLSTHLPELSRRPIDKTRVTNLVKHAFPALLRACGGTLNGKRVLDVACNCGGFSLEARKLGADYVLGIDIVDRYIEQARFVKRALGVRRVDFETMSLEALDPSTTGSFDVTLCLGLLYHLQDPVRALKQIAAVTRGILLVDTKLMRSPALVRRFVREPLWLMNFPPPASLDSNDTTGMWRSERVAQFTPNERAVVALLEFVGFAKVERLEPKLPGLEKRYYAGTRGTFLATRT